MGGTGPCRLRGSEQAQLMVVARQQMRAIELSTVLVLLSSQAVAESFCFKDNEPHFKNPHATAIVHDDESVSIEFTLHTDDPRLSVYATVLYGLAPDFALTPDFEFEGQKRSEIVFQLLEEK